MALKLPEFAYILFAITYFLGGYFRAVGKPAGGITEVIGD